LSTFDEIYGAVNQKQHHNGLIGQSLPEIRKINFTNLSTT